MIRASRATFPFTIGAYLCATLWLQRTGIAHAGDVTKDLLGSIAAYTAVAALGWAVAARFTVDGARRALVALLFGLWSVLYGSYFVFAASAFGRDVGVLVVWTLLFGAFTVLVLRTTARLDGVARALNAAGVVMLVLAVVALRSAFPAPVEPAAWTDARGATRPDIYIIIPDKYSGPAWLARTYGVDHGPFEDSLRALGFVIPRGARPNYAHTKLALPTLLEGQYVALPGDTASDRTYDGLNERIKHSPLWADLSARGYRTAFFTSTFSGSTEVSGVDLVLRAPVASTARLAHTWTSHSPMVTLGAMRCRLIACAAVPRTPFPIEPLDALEWKLRTLATLPDSAGPIGAVLHLISPHEPFLFNDDCSAREPWWPFADSALQESDTLRAAYAAQVRCLDRRLLGTVRTLIAKSEQPPVIIIQSDHGRGHVTVDVLRGISKELEDIADSQLGERFSIFAAYRFPGADTLVYDGMTPVNALPMMMHGVFGDPYERRPDLSFWSPYQRAFDLTEITPAHLERIGRER